MKLSMLAAAAVLLTATAAVAAEPKATPTPVAGKTTVIERSGRMFLESKGASTAAFLAPAPELTQDGRLAFLLVIVNGKGGPVQLDETAITATSNGAQPVQLITRAKLVAEGRSRALKEQMAQTKAAMMMSGAGRPPPGAMGNAGNAASTRPGSNNNPATLAQGQSKAGDEILSMRRATSAVDSASEMLLVKPATVGPGENANTFMAFTRLDPRATTLEVKVQTGADVHAFNFDVSRR
jgi:hypothetical protein